MAISSDMFRGHTETIILNILRKGDSYGYEITKFIKERSDSKLDIKDATIYTAFRRMEQEGYITTYWGDGVGGARRRYYSITPLGKKVYRARVKEWTEANAILKELIQGGDDNYAEKV